MGTFLNPDTTRIVAKRVVLTGHPFKVHKKTATVRYMFFNSGRLHLLLFNATSYMLFFQTMYTISSPSNFIQNTAERAIYANPSGRMDISRPISMVPSIKWTPSVCPCTNGFSRSGHDFGLSMVDHLRPRTSSQTQWKNNSLIDASYSRKFLPFVPLFFFKYVITECNKIFILQTHLHCSQLYISN
jgi:hypothetical protein